MEIFKIWFFKGGSNRDTTLAQMIVSLEQIMSERTEVEEPRQPSLYKELYLENDIMTCIINDEQVLKKFNAKQEEYNKIIIAISVDEIVRIFEDK